MERWARDQLKHDWPNLAGIVIISIGNHKVRHGAPDIYEMMKARADRLR